MRKRDERGDRRIRNATRRAFCALTLAFFFRSAFAVAAEETRATSSDFDKDWILFADDVGKNDDLHGARPVGRIETVDVSGVEVEDPRDGRVVSYKFEQIRAVVLRPGDDPEGARSFCARVAKGDFKTDRVRLRNGDEFPCRFLRLDRRRLYLEVFGREIVVPRGRASAVRFQWRDDSSSDLPAGVSCVDENAGLRR